MAERAPLHLSLLTSEEKKKKQAHAALPLPAVRDVILWTLFNAGILIFSIAVAVVLVVFANDMVIYLMCLINHPPSTVRMTDAEVAVAQALMLGTLSCIALQAAAGVLALMLPRHPRKLRLVLAYAALVATAAGHGMFAGFMFVVAEPGGGLSFFTIIYTAEIFFFAVGDLLCFLGLILRGGEE